MKKSLFLIIVFLFGVFNSIFAQEFVFEDPFAAVKAEINKKSTLLSFETKRLSAKYPSEVINKIGMNYPGYRGPGQLVVYYPGFGKTTGTNEFGMEAVVEDGVVVRLTGANSIIPKNGFIISGHGSSKNWIKSTLKTGTNVIIEGNTVIAYTTPESYLFNAKEKIKEAEQFISNARKSDLTKGEDKKAAFYLKKAKAEYKKAEKIREVLKITYAKSSIQFSNLAIKYALPYESEEFKGVWIRPTERTLADVQKTLDNIKSTGINEIFLETFFHGYTIYPSNVMRQYGFTYQNPKFNSFDPLGAYVSEARKRGMRVHCWFESFYAGNIRPEADMTSILSVNPSWGNKNLANYDFEGYVPHKIEHGGFFLDPANSEVTEFLLALINEIVTKYRVDGINLDYTRYPTSQKFEISGYEQSNWGYTEVARKEFKELYGTDPIEIKKDDALWKKWAQYRQDKITDYVRNVKKVVNNKALLTAVIFPDYDVCLPTKQQDWVQWSKEDLTDAMTPLIMTSDNELFYQILKEVKDKVSGKTNIYTGIFVGFLEAEPEDLLRQISVSRGLKTQGIVLFDWAHLPYKYQSALKSRVFAQK